MKSEIDNTVPECNYPCLMEHIGLGGKFIVLFSKPHTGMVVNSTESCRSVGYYSESWALASFKYNPELAIRLSN